MTPKTMVLRIATCPAPAPRRSAAANQSATHKEMGHVGQGSVELSRHHSARDGITALGQLLGFGDRVYRRCRAGLDRLLTTRRTIGLASAILIAGASITPPAKAQEAWVERGEIVAQLAKSYAEAPAALGVTTQGAVLELFRTPDGTSLTLVITLPTGLSSVIASGDAWIPVPQKVKGRAS